MVNDFSPKKKKEKFTFNLQKKCGDESSKVIFPKSSGKFTNLQTNVFLRYQVKIVANSKMHISSTNSLSNISKYFKIGSTL